MRGTLLDLVVDTAHVNHFEAQRMIDGFKSDDLDLSDLLSNTLVPPPEFPSFSQDVVDRMASDFWGSPGHVYMTGRLFEDQTLKEFYIGYSEKNKMVAVPMHDASGSLVGIIGRSIEGKSFKNSVRLPTSKTLWNIHRAKAAGSDTVIICESSFDAMRIFQAGYPNVVATLSGNFSPYHAEQLDRYFSTIIIMTDMDDPADHTYDRCRVCRAEGLKVCKGHNPGRALGETISKRLGRKQILWASHEPGLVFPHHAKDAGNMTDFEIRTCIKNAVTNFTYHQWNIAA